MGASVADPQPDSRWPVLLDPAGHPFCITTVAGVEHDSAPLSTREGRPFAGEVFGKVRPATPMVEVSRLIDAVLLIEIEADAVVP